MSGETISHDAARRRYSLVIDGTEAYLTYERPKDHRMHITHTIVPDRVGGRGLGKRLVARALEDAMAAGDRVSSSCWFATALIGTSSAWTAQMA